MRQALEKEKPTLTYIPYQNPKTRPLEPDRTIDNKIPGGALK